jgi:hypothetical protein
MRDKLAGAESATDAVPAMLETIDKALQDTAADLAARGVPQEQIDAAVARFKQKLSREIGELAGTEAPPDVTPVTTVEQSAIAVREVVRERYALDVLTAEGDRVSIRFKSLNVTDVAAAQVTRDGATATAVEAQVISRGRFKVEVDGDLNDAELAAIGDLLDKVDGIAQDFFGGDVQAAFAAASRVGLESDALSAFSLRLSYSKSLSAAQTYARMARLGGDLTQPTVPAPEAPAAGSPTPSSPVPATGGGASPSAPSSAVAPVTSPVAETTQAAAPVDSAVPAATEAPADSAPAPAPAGDAPSASRTLGAFVKDVLARLSSAGDTEYASFSMRWKVEFLMTAISSVAATPTEQAAAGALGQALDAQVPAEA